jgi:hypothetical protein
MTVRREHLCRKEVPFGIFQYRQEVEDREEFILIKLEIEDSIRMARLYGLRSKEYDNINDPFQYG